VAQKVGHKKTRDPTQGENPESLSQLSLVWYWDVTDRRTDRRTDRITTASTRLALCAVTRN